MKTNILRKKERKKERENRSDKPIHPMLIFFSRIGRKKKERRKNGK